MKLSYDLAKKLKDAGFPQPIGNFSTAVAPDDTTHPYKNGESVPIDWAYAPTLSELIEACNPFKADEFLLSVHHDRWSAFYRYYGFFEHNDKFKQPDDGMYEIEAEEFGTTPEEAVANLWLALNTK